MRLSASPLITFNTVNSFTYGNQWTINQGDTNTLYFQLFDLDQGPTQSIGNPYYNGNYSVLSTNTGLRYIAGVGTVNQPAAIAVTFPDTNTSTTFNANQDPNDGSIWFINIPTSAQLAGGNVIFSLTEGTNTRTFSVLNMLAVQYPGADSSC